MVICCLGHEFESCGISLIQVGSWYQPPSTDLTNLLLSQNDLKYLLGLIIFELSFLKLWSLIKTEIGLYFIFISWILSN